MKEIQTSQVNELIAFLCMGRCKSMGSCILSLPGFSVYGILQARILEQGCHFPSGDLPDPWIKATSPALAGRLFTTVPPGKPALNDSNFEMFFRINSKNYILPTFHLSHWSFRVLVLEGHKFRPLSGNTFSFLYEVHPSPRLYSICLS